MRLFSVVPEGLALNNVDIFPPLKRVGYYRPSLNGTRIPTSFWIGTLFRFSATFHDRLLNADKSRVAKRLSLDN